MEISLEISKNFFSKFLSRKLTFIWLAKLSFLRFRATGLLVEVRNLGSTTYCFCGMYSCLISSIVQFPILLSLLVHTKNQNQTCKKWTRKYLRTIKNKWRGPKVTTKILTDSTNFCTLFSLIFLIWISKIIFSNNFQSITIFVIKIMQQYEKLLTLWSSLFKSLIFCTCFSVGNFVSIYWSNYSVILRSFLYRKKS